MGDPMVYVFGFIAIIVWAVAIHSSRVDARKISELKKQAGIPVEQHFDDSP